MIGRVERVLVLPCAAAGAGFAEGLGEPLRGAVEGGFGGEVEGRLLDARGHARDEVGVWAGVAEGVEAGAVVAGLGGGRVVDAVEGGNVRPCQVGEGGGDEGVEGGFGGDVGVR